MDYDCLISFAAVTCLKFLFLPMYKSTDFEVHRNWMAITSKTSLKNWYYEDTSQWTLDYPPFFAWFEYVLSHIAKYFDQKMLLVENLNYQSPQTIFFMRISVILSDLVYFYGVNRLFKFIKDREQPTDDPWIKREVILAMLLLWNPGLLLVDHIHFQYNGFLNGILLLSIVNIFEENFVNAAFWYAVLLNFKHIYLYFAPAYFIYLLKNYCFKKVESDGKVIMKNFLFVNVLKLASVVGLVCLISLGPFVYLGQIKQVVSRLFPLKRGLTHAYWAPNVWALYNFCDRILSFLAPHLNIPIKFGDLNSCSTKGLVEECEQAILPTISTSFTIFMAILSICPIFWIVWKQPNNPKVFIQSIVLSAFGSFLFGYHVHEKAILMIIVPLTITAVNFKEEAAVFTFLSVIGHFSLFPLLNEEAETPIKVLLLLLHTVYVFSSLTQLHKMTTSIVPLVEQIYLFGILALQTFYSIGLNAFGLEKKLPFLPLMLISTYCSVGVVYAWVKYMKSAIKSELPEYKNGKKS